ncbi:MAG: CotH kinase family protein [Candidatus Electryonea clarkiae]|nr:CotH kinase family protein [Candidatus Electryonea clarkiae]MDP8288341.1 CotH kinase family protein [Candidatus Electryonea clarkiae]
MKRYLLIFSIIVFSSVSISQELVINEFLARNVTIAADQNGEFDDWIELYNNGDNSISLDGYFLSDNALNLTKWLFPDTTIFPHEYLVVWTDNDVDQDGLHAGFRLSTSGDDIYLVDTDTMVVDEVYFGVQSADISTGRFPNGTGDFISMYPTFSEPNVDDSPEIVDSTEIVFDNTIVHNFELIFYIENWEDSLTYNYEELDEEYMPAQLIYNGNVILDSVGVRYKGNSSYTLSSNTPKKPFKFRFDKYKGDQTLHGIERLNFSNCMADPSFMREKIGYDITRQYMPAPRTAYSNLYIEGELIGFYLHVEQIDKLFIGRYFENNNSNLYKASDDGATLLYRGDEQAEYETEYDLKTNKDISDWGGLIEMIDQLNNTPSEGFTNVMMNYLNLDNCIRHLAFNMLLSHFDSYTGSGRNFYLYDDQVSGQFHIIPWDMNETFGSYSNNWNVITQDITNQSNLSQRPLIKRILENDSLKQVYLDYMQEMINGPASLDSVAIMADRIKPLIDNHVQADNNKLYSYQDFIDNIEEDVYVNLGELIPGIKSFSQARNENVLLQINGDDVYPGDTDNNGIVDEYDILPIGVYFLRNGDPRDSVSFSWAAHHASAWDITAATYADANGDGVIDEKDVIGIGINWGNNHPNTTQSYAIDLNDQIFLNQYESNFNQLYNSLSGESDPAVAMKEILRSFLEIDVSIPGTYSVTQNYPNPFNNSTIIGFSLPDKQHVTFTIYNVLGQMVSIPLNNQLFQAGQYDMIFNASGLSSGTYIYKIQTNNWQYQRIMILIN